MPRQEPRRLMAEKTRTPEANPEKADPGEKPGKTLIFHIGNIKAGSTALQLAFAQNQVVLPQRKIFYPEVFNSNHLKPALTALAAGETGARDKRFRTKIEDFAREIRETDADYCIVSSELFENIPAAGFCRVIDEFFADAADEIRVVAYMRPHAERLLSTFAERFKIGEALVQNGTLESFFTATARDRRFAFAHRYENWRACLGERFILRPMIRARLHNGSVVDDFIVHGLGERSYRILGDKDANESLGLKDLMRMRVLHRQLAGVDRHVRRGIGWEFQRITGMFPDTEAGGKLRLHRSLAEKIRDTYLEDARQIDRAFFGGEPLLEARLTMAVDNAVETPVPLEPEDHLSAGDLRACKVFSELLHVFLRESVMDWGEFLLAIRLLKIDEKREENLEIQQNHPHGAARPGAPVEPAGKSEP